MPLDGGVGPPGEVGQLVIEGALDRLVVIERLLALGDDVLVEILPVALVAEEAFALRDRRGEATASGRQVCSSTEKLTTPLIEKLTTRDHGFL